MPRTYKLKEPNPERVFPSPFGVGNDGVPAFECLRLLSGLVDLERREDGGVLKLRYCYLSQKNRRPSAKSIDSIIDIIFDGDLSASDAEGFLHRSSNDNRKFFEELSAELCFCITANKKKASVESFLHLYRIFELISVALPLVYASQMADYREAMNFIKSLSASDRDQDLSVLKYFSESIVKRNSTLRSLTIDFPFGVGDRKLSQELIRQLSNYVFHDKKIIYSVFDDESGVSISFQSIPRFVVSCRNRLFHNAISNENFKLDPLKGANTVCSMMIDPCLYWLSLMYAEIIKAQAKRYV